MNLLRIFLSHTHTAFAESVAIRLKTIMNVSGGDVSLPQRRVAAETRDFTPAEVTARHIAASNVFAVFVPDYAIPKIVKDELRLAAAHIPPCNLLVIHLAAETKHGLPAPDGFTRIYADPAYMASQLEALADGIDGTNLPDREKKRLYALLLLGIGIYQLHDQMK